LDGIDASGLSGRKPLANRHPPSSLADMMVASPGQSSCAQIYLERLMGFKGKDLEEK
jgi:hypothetical protein